MIFSQYLKPVLSLQRRNTISEQYVVLYIWVQKIQNYLRPYFRFHRKQEVQQFRILWNPVLSIACWSDIIDLHTRLILRCRYRDSTVFNTTWCLICMITTVIVRLLLIHQILYLWAVQFVLWIWYMETNPTVNQMCPWLNMYTYIYRYKICTWHYDRSWLITKPEHIFKSSSNYVISVT